MKKFTAALLALIMCLSFISLFAISAAAAGEPEFFLTTSTKDVKVGDEVEVVLSVRNGKDLASGELWIEFNPYRLVYLSAELSEAAKAESGLQLVFPTENTSRAPQYSPDDSKLLLSGIPCFFIHLTQFSDNVNNADLCTFKFLAIGGGDCRLEFLARDIEIVKGDPDHPEKVSAKASDGAVPIDGELASDWDYDVSVPEDVTVPGEKGTDNKKTMVIIAIVIIVIIGGVVALVMALKQNSFKDDDDSSPEDKASEAKKE